jgi:hypothetical protein
MLPFGENRGRMLTVEAEEERAEKAGVEEGTETEWVKGEEVWTAMAERRPSARLMDRYIDVFDGR